MPRLDIVYEVKIGVTDDSLGLARTMVITGLPSFDMGNWFGVGDWEVRLCAMEKFGCIDSGICMVTDFKNVRQANSW